ncbi:S-layer domain protein [Dethiosulfovibrio peptidovorans DSM 11002]|uniref:S-layer domain protein n=1 Tax=Dethiosulfovibrio peptidovorans DSM 11002 TaxID=469381 RepID=D2Z337_9BACT|nr:S-layer homology domain-containing protein [Dethiosulfovibrio peptidovorans]EFC90255.1 S-layer domain protein [Dethiosulfovibrio peptidovorans DSM 11002]
MKKLCALLAVVALVAFAAPAFAANPFMDVPMNHWAYDAVGQLAARGIISGYPDGTFKGNQPITRYEMASVTARALAVIDMEKASKQDVEMLKRLVVEFKDELDALGVKVDKIDSRVAVLEENIGGWKFWGELRFDAKFEGERNLYNDEYTLEGDKEFNLNRFRLWMSKQIDENTKFVARLGTSDSTTKYAPTRWERYYLETKLPYDIKMTAGLWLYDWEWDSGLYIDEDAWFTDAGMKGFWFQKSFGLGDVQAMIGHDDSYSNGADGIFNTVDDVNSDYMFYGLRANFNFNEQFRFALNGLMRAYDDLNNQDESVYWADFTFNFNPNIAFKGAYFMEDLDAPKVTGGDDSPSAYKAILDVKQDALKFTSIWIEYAKFDEGFSVWNNNNGGDAFAYDAYGASVLYNRGYDDTTILFGSLKQQWNDKWATYERYLTADFDATGVDDATNWTFGVLYYYTPAITFDLAYDKVDWGDSTSATTHDGTATRTGDDNIVRFRTHVKF